MKCSCISLKSKIAPCCIIESVPNNAGVCGEVVLGSSIVGAVNVKVYDWSLASYIVIGTWLLVVHASVSLKVYYLMFQRLLLLHCWSCVASIRFLQD